MSDKIDLKNSLKKLDEIINELNKEDFDLQDSLDKFKEGVKLIKGCRKELEKTENEFIKIKEDLDE
ncbi:MAG: exodeoxyribonuclease VII small subunit [Candidatus Pacebacteria bacterium]|nr:exodeoxyribonuclease VII small subunit [Candidatus Paceibacterota bacterium]